MPEVSDKEKKTKKLHRRMKIFGGLIMPEYEMSYRERKTRQHRKNNIIIIISALFGLFIFSTPGFFYEIMYSMGIKIYPGMFTLIGLGLTIISVFLLLMRYLQTGEFFKLPHITDRSNESDYPIHQHKLEKRIDNQQNQINALMESLNEAEGIIHNINADETELLAEHRKKMIDNLKERLKSVASEELLEDLKNQAYAKLELDNKIEMVSRRCSATIIRLKEATSALNFKSNLNLVFGIAITIIGLVLFFSYVSDLPKDTNGPWPLAANFLPRLSLIIFIEFFAYFFLKLYKSNLLEVKYVHNELTNIESKHIALQTALLNDDQEAVSKVVYPQSVRHFSLENQV
jgi:hypothetical protein